MSCPLTFGVSTVHQVVDVLSRWLPCGDRAPGLEAGVLLLAGDDWAEDHHDVELMDASGKTLAQVRLPEGAAGMARLHALIGAQPGEAAGEDAEVRAGIETGRGLWVTALVAAGYLVFGINPGPVARYRGRHGVPGAQSDTADAHALADMVRTGAHQLRAAAAGSPAAQAVKVVARAHKTLIWERVRQAGRLRHQLRDLFPAALAAYGNLGLDSADVLELLAKAPGPAPAARLTTAQISAALTRAHRHDITAKTAAIRAALRSPQLSQPPRSPPPQPPWCGPWPR
jgi:transposase